MKKFAKSLMVSILGWQVRRLCKKRDIQVVAVAGSIGKTSTKLAIAQALQQKFRVQYQDGNYNDTVSVPLIFFGLSMPSLLNPLAWIATILKAELRLHKNYPWDVVVVEVGTDYPGNIGRFKKYLHANIAVLTAVAPEHMENFADLDAVAQEELRIAQLTDKLVVNKDLIDAKYLGSVKVDATYGKHELADYRIDADGVFKVTSQGKPVVDGLQVAHGPQRYSFTAAAAVGHLLGMTEAQIAAGLQSIQPVSGRGRRLTGIQESVVIDDTYNASPEAVKGALDLLYQEAAPQKIAILGNMNELGRFSQAAHQEIGTYCDPKQISLVLTIGPDANTYLAPAAKAKGCQVASFDNPYELAAYLKPLIKPKALILAKGSQNKVFAEEAVKLLLANPSDQSKLVRQSPHWLAIKEKQFGKA